MNSTSTVPVFFHQLSFVPEGDEVVVGRPDTETYVVLPADGAALLNRMTGGAAPDAAAEWYEATYGEAVDIDEFLDTLRELGFVRDAEPAAASVRPPGLRRLGRAVFSPVAFACYAAIVVAWVFVVAAHPDLLPAPGQIFFTGSLVVVQLVVTCVQWPLIFLHESFHVLAGRRLGLPSTLGVSNRLIDIVFETRMNTLLSVPRRQRYLPFLAGMLCDAVVTCLFGLLAEITRAPDGALSLAGRIALALAFTGVIRLAWQFQLYLRTDLYYVFATALNCHDLHDASMALVRNRLWALLRQPGRIVEVTLWTDRDLRVGRWYGPCIAFGVVVFLAITAFASIPIAVQYIGIIAHRIGAGRIDAGFWDSVVSLALNLGNVGVLIYLSRRKRRQDGNPSGMGQGSEAA